VFLGNPFAFPVQTPKSYLAKVWKSADRKLLKPLLTNCQPTLQVPQNKFGIYQSLSSKLNLIKLIFLKVDDAPHINLGNHALGGTCGKMADNRRTDGGSVQ
jgi:hypothetical protein